MTLGLQCFSAPMDRAQPMVARASLMLNLSHIECLADGRVLTGAECGAFGLIAQGKVDNLSGLSFRATPDAYVAIVKSGNHGCGLGSSAYRYYVNVSRGQLLSTPVDQNISHVTYCACP